MTNELYISRTKKAHSSHDSSHEHPALVSENGFIVVRTGLQNGCPFLSVQDSGIGIPRSERERIFERFYRIDKSRSREKGGTGLGLAIVNHIAEIHDAKITVDSEVGQGTCITVLFKASAPGSQNPSAI